MKTIPKNTICLWYSKDAEAAAQFYASVFPDSHVGAVDRSPKDNPGNKAGDVMVVEFLLDEGSRCLFQEVKFAELPARDTSLSEASSQLEPQEREALIGSLEWQVPLGDFEQAT